MLNTEKILLGDGSANILVDVAALLDGLKGGELLGDHVTLLPGHLVALLTWHLHVIAILNSLGIYKTTLFLST
jgi:hypothetical protein